METHTENLIVHVERGYNRIELGGITVTEVALLEAHNDAMIRYAEPFHLRIESSVHKPIDIIQHDHLIKDAYELAANIQCSDILGAYPVNKGLLRLSIVDPTSIVEVYPHNIHNRRIRERYVLTSEYPTALVQLYTEPPAEYIDVALPGHMKGLLDRLYVTSDRHYVRKQPIFHQLDNPAPGMNIHVTANMTLTLAIRYLIQ